MDFTRRYDSPIGPLTLVSDGTALTGLLLDDPKDCPIKPKELPVFRQTVRWLDIYFSGKEPDFTPPLNLRTGPFRREVWEIMLTIPYGRTMTYGEIATEIARRHGLAKMSAQAVGGAVGHNAIPIIIPCHRVIGANGNLTGYGGGIERKIKLLELEGIDLSRMFIPHCMKRLEKPPGYQYITRIKKREE